MSEGDDGFEIRLGRIRSPAGVQKSQRFLRQAARGAGRLAGVGKGRNRLPRSSGRALHFYRRVLVKARIVRMVGRGAGAQRLHLSYIARDGAGRDGGRAGLFDAAGEADANAFLDRGAGDRHQFRFVISPEDAADMADLPAFTRDFVAQMEVDLETRLDWVAADHYDTDHPHIHLVVAGRREDGRDLVMPRAYIAHGVRERAQALVDLELGPVSEFDGKRRLARMVGQDRLTEIDRSLIRRAEGGVADLKATGRPGEHWLRRIERARLRKLERFGLAEALDSDRWRLRTDTRATLERMGARGDVVKAINCGLARAGRAHTVDSASIYDAAAKDASAMTGRVVALGVADDVEDRAYVLIDREDGRVVYVDIGGSDRLAEVEAGFIVTVTPSAAEPRLSDKTIARIADENNGRYSAQLHRAADPGARAEFISAHVRRLEAMRRVGCAVRSSNGEWTIPGDYLARAAAIEQARAVRRPVEIDIRSKLSLGAMKTAIGATWLDRHLRDYDIDESARGFGGDVARARRERLAFLEHGGFIKLGTKRLAPEILDALKARDLEEAGADLSKRLQKPYVAAPDVGEVHGVYAEAIERPSGRYALIEWTKDFTLVPWRDVLERGRGKAVSGVVRGGGISWKLTKGRSVS
ncbi:MAG: DUF3363 domain-containing protein [Pseudomonadota bacterium]